jgi:hypothetical protein
LRWVVQAGRPRKRDGSWAVEAGPRKCDGSWSYLQITPNQLHVTLPVQAAPISKIGVGVKGGALNCVGHWSEGQGLEVPYGGAELNATPNQPQPVQCDSALRGGSWLQLALELEAGL